MNNINKIRYLLSEDQQYSFILLFIFMIIGTFLETLSIGLIIPAVSLLLEPQRISELVPQAESQNEAQVDTIPRPRSEQVSQPEIVSDTGSVASSESVQSLSMENDAAGDIEEPTFIEDVPTESILRDPQEEEDLLDIPAFLRRQAN